GDRRRGTRQPDARAPDAPRLASRLRRRRALRPRWGNRLVALPHRLVWLLPAGLAALLVATAVSAAEDFIDRSQAARLAYTAPNARWLDHHPGAPVTYLYDGAHDFRTVWSQLFWNSRLEHVLDLPAMHVPGP